MECGFSRLTVFFEDPFWVGVLEREDGGKLEGCKLTFGAQPKDYEVYELLLERWRALEFSPGVPAERRDAQARSPKRMQRLAAGELGRTGVGTKAQQALQLQREQNKQERRTAGRRRDEAEEERRFQLRQQKKKEKHRGR